MNSKGKRVLTPPNRNQTPLPSARPGLIQQKVAPTPFANRRSVAPAVYRPGPIPKVLQTKTSNNPKQTLGNQPRQTPAAPPVYRPQPIPKVLQQRSAISTPPSLNQKSPTGRPAAKLPIPGVPTNKAVQRNQSVASKQHVVAPSRPNSVGLPHSQARHSGVVQRMIVPLYWKNAMGAERDEDRQEVDRGVRDLKKRPDSGGRTLADAGNLNGIPNHEVIYVHGHGSPGLVGGYNAQEIEAMLTGNGLQKTYTGTIFVAACMSAASTYMGLGKSVAGKLAELLKAGGYQCTVKGMDYSLIITDTGEFRVPKMFYDFWRNRAGKSLLSWRDEAQKLQKGQSTHSEFTIRFNLDKYQRQLQSVMNDYTEVAGALHMTSYSGDEYKPIVETLGMLANSG